MASEDTIWRSKYMGNEYEVTTRDLTVGRLRQLKAWFGDSYGAYSPFIVLLAQGDIDALCCVVWIAQKKAGENPPEPSHMDFSLADFEAIPEKKARAKKADPTPAATPTTA